MQSKLPFDMKAARGAPELDQFGFPVKRTSRSGSVTDASGSAPVFWVFAIIAIAVTLLQKIGYGSSPDAIVPLVVPVTLGALIMGLAFARPVFDSGRLMLYFLFVIVSGLTTAIFASNYSFKSFALYAVLYLPMTIAFHVSDATYRRCMSFFCNLMLAIVGIVLAQHAVQLTIGWQYWPNLDEILPKNMLIPFFNYVQPIVWGMNYMKPNGVFFLEVSFLSQFIALALGIEIVLFKRWSRIAVFTGAVFITFAGTGLLLLLLTLPVLVGRVSIRNMILSIIVFAVVGWLAWWLGWVDLVSHRLTEFDRSGASANMRFVEPFNRLAAFVSDPESLYRGIGAGQIEKSLNFQWWPITKAILEYGVVPGILFYAYFLYAMFNRAPSLRIAFMLVIWFSFEGALLTAVNPIACALLSTMFIVGRRKG